MSPEHWDELMTCADRPVVLMYHSISAGHSPLKVSPALFAEQMAWLKQNANVVRLNELVEALTQHRLLPKRSVVLTFDDGFQNFYTHAAPILLRLGFPASVFLPTSYCGKTNVWPSQLSWVDEEPLMTWQQVCELTAQGISFGAHGATHAALTDLSSADAEREIAGSKRELEDQCGRVVDFFCYPYGRWNPAVRECVRRYYRGACTTAAAVVAPDADPFALPRVDIHYLRSSMLFQSLFTRRFCTYVAARRWVRRLRGQPEGSYARS